MIDHRCYKTLAANLCDRCHAVTGGLTYYWPLREFLCDQCYKCATLKPKCQ